MPKRKSKNEEILSRLKTECSFQKAHVEREPNPDNLFPELRWKVGHVRADHDGCRWHNTIWRTHRELETPEICREIDAVYTALTSDNALRDLDALSRFCERYPEARVTPDCPDEFNFYLEGKACNFWLRLITRQKDYNIYLNAFVKGV